MLKLFALFRDDWRVFLPPFLRLSLRRSHVVSHLEDRGVGRLSCSCVLAESVTRLGQGEVDRRFADFAPEGEPDQVKNDAIA